MKIVAVSDTHGLHNRITVPPGDMVIHAGDVSMEGANYEIEGFLKWFSALPHRYKIFVAGNHDFYFERMPEEVIKERIPGNVIYLEDSGITIDGFKIWGSPIQPWFMDWAFNRQRGAEIKKHWDIIPRDTDILITHGPPYGILDELKTAGKVGCEELLIRVKEINPKAHLFGHIHEGYGVYESNGTRYINASSVDLNYNPVNAPVVFEVHK